MGFLRSVVQKLSLLVLLICVPQCQGGCAEVDSMTEAVAGESFLMGCISCKTREEVRARATVDWYFKSAGEEEFTHIFNYDHPVPDILHEDFDERLEWQGTLGEDVQIGAILIHNVTFNDTGTYLCSFKRTLFLPFEEFYMVEKEVELTVVAVATRELTAVVSEIAMYVLIVVLQLWMIVVVIYCYKKISAEHEAREARKALRLNRLLEAKDNCERVHLE
ncbi:sodium channel regulatory subunit beta-1 [Aplochiton taeniatus]